MALSADVLVVGGGMSAIHAAQTLIEAGRSVTMVDAGVRPPADLPAVPEDDFMSLRERDPDQHRYFLGDAFEGVPWGPAAHGLTPPRRYITEGTGRWCPVRSESFHALESLAYGGLGNGWGAGCAVYAPIELEAMGLDPVAMADAYRVIAARIGLAAQIDDATPYCSAGLEQPHEPLRMDASVSMLYAAYLERRARLKRRGLVMGKDPMAALSRPLGGRGQVPYTDMEFWADPARAIWRPWMSLDDLRRHDRFRYEGGHLATHIAESDGAVVVRTRQLADGGEASFQARRAVLACGALGTARLVMRTTGTPELPLLTNGYAIAACLHPPMLGRVLERRRTSLGQLEMFHDPRGDGLGVRMASLYTYRSLLLFKLVKEAPIALADALLLLRAIEPALVLATINHPDAPAPGKRCRLFPDADSPTGDALEVEHEPSKAERRADIESQQAILWGLRQIGCLPLRVQPMPQGSTVHYAGVLPFADDGRANSLGRDGRLAGTRAVYVADGSGFRYLPANGHSFTLMANAHLVARGIAATWERT